VIATMGLGGRGITRICNGEYAMENNIRRHAYNVVMGQLNGINIGNR